MSTIKFRIWDTHEKKFYEPTCEAYNGKLDMLFIDLDGDLIRQTMTGLVHESMFPDRYIKQQYIGCKDAKGREIYEGDIIQWKWGVAPGYPEPTPEVVQWHEALRGFEPFCFYDSHCDGVPEVSDHDGYEIIGNIFANPELLPAEAE